MSDEAKAGSDVEALCALVTRLREAHDLWESLNEAALMGEAADAIEALVAALRASQERARELEDLRDGWRAEAKRWSMEYQLLAARPVVPPEVREAMAHIDILADRLAETGATADFNGIMVESRVIVAWVRSLLAPAREPEP